MSYPKDYDNVVKSLPVERMNEVGKQAVELLASKSYEVTTGLTPEYADGIAMLCREPSIREYCPKDSTERFSSRQTTSKWLAKGRATFLLFQKLDTGETQLAGYGWVGAKRSEQVPDGETTFSLRIGETHQGKGLAGPFALSMLAAAAVLYDIPHMWLETWASNGGAVHVYNKIGFRTIAEKTDMRPTITGKLVEDTRLYMIPEQDIKDAPVSS